MIVSTLLAGLAALTLQAGNAPSRSGAFVCGTAKPNDPEDLARALAESCDPAKNFTVTDVNSNGYSFQLRFCCVAKADAPKTEAPKTPPEKP